MNKIALIYMGGTFGCIGDPLSPMPELDFKPQLQRILLKPIDIDFFTAHQVKDSSACTAVDWLQLIQQIQHLQEQNYHHFIVIHGTDTLSYAAATLSRMLHTSSRVILTASQYPLLNIEGNDLRTFTDALDNLNTAIDALEKIPLGVYVAFHHKIMHARSIQKIHTTALDAFSGIDYRQPFDFADVPFKIEDQHLEQAQQLNIINWTMHPIESKRFAQNLALLTQQAPDVLILQAYGTGNISVNDEIIEKFADLIHQKCQIILDTQVPFGGIDQRYAISQWVNQTKILINNTQSHADLYAKVLKMYLQYPSSDQWHDHWYQQ